MVPQLSADPDGPIDFAIRLPTVPLHVVSSKKERKNCPCACRAMDDSWILISIRLGRISMVLPATTSVSLLFSTLALVGAPVLLLAGALFYLIRLDIA